MLGIIVALLIAVFSLFLYYQLPVVDELQNVKLNEPLKIYSRDNKLISEIGQIKRTPVTFDQIPKLQIYAFLAAEDSRFFSHIGIDIWSLVRAVWQYVSDADQKTGASTITMQLARNFYLTRARTVWRKYREILLAFKIERELSKEQIMTLYLNKIFLGHKSYGIAAAANNYYSRKLDELSISQMATLAGLPKAPSKFNPVVNPKRAKERRDWILGRMLDLEYIDNQEYESALAEDITPTPFWNQTDIDAQYVAEMVRLKLLTGDLLAKGGADQDYVYNQGLRVYTTIDSKLQNHANKAVVLGIMQYEERHGYKGKEKHFSLFDDIDSNDALFSIDEKKLRSVIKEIEKLSDFGGTLIPALVYDVTAESLSLLLTDGRKVELTRDKNFPFKGKFINVNKVSKAGQFDTLFVKGDLVRIRKDEAGNWLLAQIPSVQASLSSIDPIDGAIRALVGGFYYYHSEYNRAIQANRLLGSTIKPLIYSYALGAGYKAGSIIMDAPLRFEENNNWRPQNADLNFLGPTTLRNALYKSRNVVSVRLLSTMKIKKVIQFLRQFSLSKRYPRDLSLALGTLSSTSLKVAQAYSAFSNGGHLPSGYLVERIEDYQGKVLYQANQQGVCYKDIVSISFPEENQKSVALVDSSTDQNITLLNEGFINGLFTEKSTAPLFSEKNVYRYCDNDKQQLYPLIERDVAYIMNDILKGIARSGTAHKVVKSIKRKDFGGKTGTTNDNIDAWFTGIHPLLSTSVWVGFDSPTPMGRIESGSKAALPIWLAYTKGFEDQVPFARLRKPKSIVKRFIDPKTGDLVTSSYPKAIQEIFRKWNLPRKSRKIIIQSGSGNSSVVLERPEDIF